MAKPEKFADVSPRPWRNITTLEIEEGFDFEEDRGRMTGDSVEGKSDAEGMVVGGMLLIGVESQHLVCLGGDYTIPVSQMMHGLSYHMHVANR